MGSAWFETCSCGNNDDFKSEGMCVGSVSVPTILCVNGGPRTVCLESLDKIGKCDVICLVCLRGEHLEFTLL